MPNLLAMSFEGVVTPSFELRPTPTGARRPDGWGLGYYPAGEPSASVLKEPSPALASLRAEVVKAWEHLESSTFVVHFRQARWGSITDANTQPFTRTWGGREWLFAHSGSLNQRPTLAEGALFEPVGSTDSEVIFCELMNRLAAHKWRSLEEADPRLLREWLLEINPLGMLSLVLSDGRDVCVYADRTHGGIYAWNLQPPYQRVTFGDLDLDIDLTRRGVKSRKGLILSSHPLKTNSEISAEWTPIPFGQLLLIRQGAIRAEVGSATPIPEDTSHRRVPRPVRAEAKQLEVRHRTVYRYTRPVERSMHLLRLTPIHDRLQRVLESRIHFSVESQQIDYEDVFGNRVYRMKVDTPFTELRIDAHSKVEVLDVDPLDFRPLQARASIPLVWMPWQRHMLNPFLLPPELPESELLELTDYAMSFVERNGYDLLDTLLDLNQSIFREYAYQQGATTLSTTPFQVYANRRGVCQDFTNLFICLMRLLGVPARYVCGYIYTGPKHANQRQSEASHAWVQVYLPEVGWRGFDPTNGVLTQTDHVRMAVGASYRDATPTSGTLFVGGGPETLEVDVQVEVSS